MQLMKNPFLIIYFICFTYSCGGVIGNIKRYKYEIESQQLKTGIELLYQKHPELIPPDSIYYNEKYKEYSLYIKDDNTYLLHFCIVEAENPSAEIAWITLLTGAEYGGILDLATNLSHKDKKKYAELFEKYFLKELSIELGKKYTIDF